MSTSELTDTLQLSEHLKPNATGTQSPSAALEGPSGIDHTANAAAFEKLSFASGETRSLEASLAAYEEYLIREAFAKAGSLRGAAKLLDCAPATLWRRAQKYGIGS